MKICYLADSIVPSRTANSVHVMKMCQAYTRLGHDVTLVIPDRPDKCEKHVDNVYSYYGVEESFKINKIWPRRPLRFWSSVVVPFLALRASKPDWVHTRSEFAAWGLTTLFRVPTVLELHEDPARNRLIARTVKSAAKQQSLLSIITVTNALANRVRNVVSGSVNIAVAPDGVDGRLVNRKTSKSEARLDVGLDVGEESRLVVYTGHLYSGRGIELIVEIAKRVSDHVFVVVGGGVSDIARWRKSTADVSNLRFVGFVPPSRVFEYLLAGDVLLMPYAKELATAGSGNTADVCSPMKMFEYLAAGRPIVASDLPVLQEVLQDHVNCIIAPYDAPDAWVRAIDELRRDNVLANSLGSRARRDSQGYTWERRAQLLMTASGFSL